MIHYHGTPMGGKREDVSRFLRKRHALISFFRTEDLGTAAMVCQSFCIDNGAFSAWRQGHTVRNWLTYYAFLEGIYRHPGFDFAIVPDVIDGSEEENDALLAEWPSYIEGAPVWHMHESLGRLERLARGWTRICIGSSGEFSRVGSWRWWERMNQAMEVVTTDGYPICKLHGLRMLDVRVFSRLPLSSADSTNAARNGARKAKQAGSNTLTGQTIIGDEIESISSAGKWVPADKQAVLF